LKPILQSDIDKILQKSNTVSNHTNHKFDFIINNSNIKYVRKFKKFDNTFREKEFNYTVDEILRDDQNNSDIFETFREKISMIAEGSSLSMIT